jgi:multisubunit Na+/H+ antiporter MnhE subunit
VQSSAASTIWRTIKHSWADFFVLFCLWMLFVSQVQRNEMLAGIGAAFIGTVASALLKAQDYAKFKPKVEWLLLSTWEIWYVISGTWAIMVAMARRIAGKPSEAQFKAVKFRAGGDDPESWARRTLVTVYATIPPNFIILGIDTQRNLMLVHQVAPTGTPEIAKRLGAEE